MEVPVQICLHLPPADPVRRLLPVPQHQHSGGEEESDLPPVQVQAYFHHNLPALLYDLLPLSDLYSHPQWKLDLCIWELCSNHSEGPTPLDHNQSCNHLGQGQERTPEEALEEHDLLESIACPELPPRSMSTPLEQTSDPAHSLFAVLPAVGGREWHVGDQLESLVIMKDFQGRPKSHGGDFLLARLHSPELGRALQDRCWTTRMGPTLPFFCYCGRGPYKWR